ncbi:MAG: sigma-70 family RNA polymerase sigma factor [Burkholderiales bacterium]
MRFEDAVRAHAAELYRYAYWLTRDRARAEDVVQEALLRGWRAFPRLREPEAARAWLFSIVRNEFRRAVGADPREQSLEGVDIPDERSDAAGLELRDALRALPPAYGEPLALQVLGGFSGAEIADLLGTTEGAVMTRLTRARQALKRLVSPRARAGGRP